MADLLKTSFSGGAAGTPVTVASEPFFTSKTGTVTYAEVDAGRMGMRPLSSGAGQMFRSSANGRSKWGLRWKTKFESSTSTSAYYFGLNLRNGTTNRADIGLRNASGRRHAAFRNNFTYVGEAAGNVMEVGEIWSFEVVVDGTSMRVKAWEGDVDFDAVLPAPTYSWGPATAAVAPDNFWFGNDSATNVSTIIFDVRFTDGESISAPAPGTLDYAMNGYADPNLFSVQTKTTGAAEVRLVYSKSADFSNSVTTAPVTPDAQGYAKLIPTGLDPFQVYYWRVKVDGVDNTALGGRSKTLPNPGRGLINFRMGWVSCFDTNTSAVFALMAARGLDYLAMLGDLGYQWLSTGPRGNNAASDIETNREARMGVLTAAGPRALFAQVANDYGYSDTDGGGANQDGTTSNGFLSGAVLAAYRQQFALRPQQRGGDFGRSWVVGSFRFILTDENTMSTSRTAADGPSKTKLGFAQRNWFFLELTRAKEAKQLVIWLGDGPYIEPDDYSTGNSNTWAHYPSERLLIGNFIANLGVKVLRLHGDTHTLFVDDGSNNPWGGFPTASAAPLHTTANPFGYPVSGGKWPTVQTASSRQYGIADFSENGSELSVQLRGYSSTNAAPTEVERFNYTFKWRKSAWDDVELDGHRPSAVYLGSDLIWAAN